MGSRTGDLSRRLGGFLPNPVDYFYRWEIRRKVEAVQRRRHFIWRPNECYPIKKRKGVYTTRLSVSAFGVAPNNDSTSFLSCTFNAKTGKALGTTALDAVGVIPGGGNVLHAIQFGAAIGAAGISVYGSVRDAGLSATGGGGPLKLLWLEWGSGRG